MRPNSTTRGERIPRCSCPLDDLVPWLPSPPHAASSSPRPSRPATFTPLKPPPHPAACTLPQPLTLFFAGREGEERDLNGRDERGRVEWMHDLGGVKAASRGSSFAAECELRKFLRVDWDRLGKAEGRGGVEGERAITTRLELSFITKIH